MKLLEEVKINVAEELRDIENFLRDNISFILKNQYGTEWENNLGVSQERIDIWKARKDEEHKRLGGKLIEARLLYYADFYDLKTIIEKNWDRTFKHIFNKKKEIIYQLEQLESFRNPNAHNRDLLEHQKYLLKGIVGEIKMCMIEYRGDLENEDTYFPKIESVNINGTIYNSGSIYLNKKFRRGDIIDITLYSSAPPNQKIYYSMCKPKCNWQESSSFHIELDNNDNIGNNTLLFFMKSDQEYHKNTEFNVYDDSVVIHFTILPK